jgi:hypothetical protein
MFHILVPHIYLTTVASPEVFLYLLCNWRFCLEPCYLVQQMSIILTNNIYKNCPEFDDRHITPTTTCFSLLIYITWLRVSFQAFTAVAVQMMVVL